MAARRWATKQASARVLAQLPKLHVAYRVVGRVRHGLLGSGNTHRRAGLAAGFAVFDAAGALWMSGRKDPPHFPLRVAADLADVAFWAIKEDDSFNNVVTVANVSSAEAGARFGLRGFTVPALQAVTVATARRLAGKRTPLYPFVWPVMSTGAGWAMASYERQRLARLRAAHIPDIAARAERARLAGQHSVAMGADPIVDLLVRTTPLLTHNGDGVRLDPVHTWKAELAGQARSTATYLADAARAWERAHNADTPILAESVDLVVGRGGDQVLLTGTQVRALHRELDSFELAGPLRLETNAARLEHRPGRPLRIVVNGSRFIDVPGDEFQVPTPIDPAPLALALMALWLLGHSNPAYENVPLSRTVPPAAVALAAAAVAYRQIAAGDEDLSAQALTTSLLVALVETVLATPAMRNNVARTGTQSFPSVSALYSPSILATIYWPRLSRPRRAFVATLTATVLALGVVLRPWPSRPRDFIAGSLLLAIAIGAASGWSDVLAQQASLVAQQIDDEAQQQEVAAYLAGRQQVIDLIESAICTARRDFDSCANQLDPSIARIVASRLGELERRLAKLR